MASSRSNGSSSQDTSDDGVVALPSTATPGPSRAGTSVVVSSADDTCGCWANGESRNCYDCLNTKLYNGERCAIDPLGNCQTIRAAGSFEPYYNSTYTVATTTNYSVIPHGNEFFWSSNATYCPESDVMCSNCLIKWLAAFQNGSLRSNFSCVGDSGCICTAYCELRRSSGNTLPSSYNAEQEFCPVRWADYNSDLLLARNITSLLVGALVIVLAVRQCVAQFHQRRYDRRMRERRRALREQRNEVGRAGLMLTLEGWNGYRAQLIEREQESLGLKASSLLTEEPTRVVVEEGESFRPASPSQLARQRSTQES